MGIEFVSMAAITVICYLLAQALKATPLDNKWLPVLCGVLGMGLGLAAYFFHIPEFPAGDPLNAAAVGISSGFAATGVNQIYKQMKKELNDE